MACTSCQEITNESSVVDNRCYLRIKCGAEFTEDQDSCLPEYAEGSFYTSWLIMENGMPFATEDCKVLTVDTTV